MHILIKCLLGWWGWSHQGFSRVTHHTVPHHILASYCPPGGMDESKDRGSAFAVFLLPGSESKFKSFWLFSRLKHAFEFCSIFWSHENHHFHESIKKINSHPLNREKRPLTNTVVHPVCQYSAETTINYQDWKEIELGCPPQGGLLRIRAYAFIIQHLFPTNVSSQNFSTVYILILYSLFYLSLVLGVEVILN